MAIDRTGISSLNTGAGEITYSGNQGPKSPDQMLMAQADPMLVEEYEKYVFEMEEMGRQPISFREFIQEIMSGMAKGGRAGYTRGGGVDYMPTDPGSMGNPAVVGEKMVGDDMREFRITNPDIEDVADYKSYYERLKRLKELMEKRMMPMSKAMEPPVYSEQDYPQFGPGMPFYQMPELNTEDYAYGGTARPTYTQKRKQNLAYGGIAGLDGRRQYGLGSFVQGLKDKFVDDIIPNEIKDNPVLSSVVAGTLLNEYGIPFTDKITGTDYNIGEDWFSDLITAGSKAPVIGPAIKTIGDVAGGIGNIIKGPDKEWLGTDILGLPGRVIGGLGKVIPDEFKTAFMTPGTDKKANWIAPVTMGLGIGAMDAATRKNETLPTQQGIDIANIRSRALTGSDPNLHFLPPAEATTAYSKGGRAGKNIFSSFSNYKNAGGEADFDTWFRQIWLPETQGIASIQPDDYMGSEGKGDFPLPGDMERMIYGFPSPPVYAAKGGRIGSRRKGYGDYVQAMNALGLEPMPIGIYNSLTPIMSDQDMVNMGSPDKKAQGGRIGYDAGGNYESKIKELMDKGLSRELAEALVISDLSPEAYSIIPEEKAQGGRIGAQEGGLMDLGGMEKDYRNEGGFVPIGGQERADDVPARLSKNEFVFTADAVRSAGGGDIDKGAEVMENVMEHLEQGGQISEESQGLEGARNMFATAQRLEGVM